MTRCYEEQKEIKMYSRIFSIVEVSAGENDYVTINGGWWYLAYDSGCDGNDSIEIGIADCGRDECYYVVNVDALKIESVPVKSYRLKVTMTQKDDTDYIEREIANYVLLEEINELLKFQRLD